MTEHVSDDLELYAVGALEPPEAARVAAHLGTCPSCQLAAEDLDRIVSTLPGTLPAREPAPALRARILSTARVETQLPLRGETAWSFRPSRRWLVGVLAAAVGLLVVLDVNAVRQVRMEQMERDQTVAQLRQIGGSGRSWYMAGKDDFAGSGGTIKVQSDGSALVLFHDLKPIAAQAHLTVWLVSTDGRWVNAAEFTPTGQKLQTVDLQAQAGGFERCAVTLQADGATRGPTVMESRIAPAN
ncbi:MAG TPA: anti-sigma factor [Candidatus Limnocylindria bacterium]|nr:anti-sigma factor [Candidatus Limnocylindria bacterium]